MHIVASKRSVDRSVFPGSTEIGCFDEFCFCHFKAIDRFSGVPSLAFLGADRGREMSWEAPKAVVSYWPLGRSVDPKLARSRCRVSRESNSDPAFIAKVRRQSSSRYFHMVTT